MSPRKFYKTIITVEVLSEYEVGDLRLREIAHEIAMGDFSGKVTHGAAVELDGKQVADALQAQGSDPGFFQLDEDGNDTDGDERPGLEEGED